MDDEGYRYVCRCFPAGSAVGLSWLNIDRIFVEGHQGFGEQLRRSAVISKILAGETHKQRS